MDLFVIAAFGEVASVAADDHMPERHRRGVDNPALEKPAGESAVELQSASLTLDFALRGERENSRQKSDGRGGRRPEIDEGSTEPAFRHPRGVSQSRRVGDGAGLMRIMTGMPSGGQWRKVAWRKQDCCKVVFSGRDLRKLEGLTIRDFSLPANRSD